MAPRSAGLFWRDPYPGLYVHNWFLFFTASQALVLVGSLSKPRLPRRGAACFIVIAVLYVPWIPFLLSQARQDQFEFLTATAGHHVAVMLEAFTGTKVPSGHYWVSVPGGCKPLA